MASLGSKCYPVVVANILADVISPLIEIIDQFLTADGVFVISGIIDTKEKEIADKLCISIHTVNIHRQNLLRKLGVQNSIEAIRLGQESGLLS